ncbi:cytochrome P450 [Actinophytocola oryzae]|uniref:Cytochrome P450 n=1 Tax=Actinophytocola oryzae TaxID=502181 RepID=A0A4R7W1N7_9PSEU|nr:cytochrome P450 [Actinophytocola oryzae]TDV56322.1 cytochrome P450 [Actinophytocola oryzae]
MTAPTGPFPSHDPFTAEDQAGFLLATGAKSPLAWLPSLDSYLVSKYEYVLRLLRDPRLTNETMTYLFDRLSPADQDRVRHVRRSVDMWMGGTTSENHARFQKLLKSSFSVSAVNALRPRVRDLTHELLDAVVGAGRMDIVADLALPLPADVIAEMLGMPAADRDLLRVWSRDVLGIFQQGTMDRLLAGQTAIEEMEDYLRPMVAARRTDPRDDLITMFTEAERDGRVTEDEIVANCVMLLFGAHQTTATVITHGLALLMRHPEQMALLRAEPDRTPAAVEEIVRFDGPNKAIARRSLQPLTIAGHDFPVGQNFLLSLQFANRDPDAYTHPDRFDITRTDDTRHLGFGMGTYYCLGAALARAQVDECLRIVLGRLPELSEGRQFGHHYTRLPVRF